MALTVAPPYPVPGRPAALTFTLTQTGANYARIWVTNAPIGSKLRGELDATGASRLPFANGDLGTDHPIQFTPDKGGVYSFRVQEYSLGATNYGGAYEDDPNGAPTETKLGNEVTLTLSVGQRVTQKLGVGLDTATLTMWVFGDHIRPTTLETQGETTPSLTGAATTRALVATESTLVKTELSGLRNLTVANALGTPSTVITDLVTVLNAHFANGASHYTTDTHNALGYGLSSATGPKALAAQLTAILGSLRRHMTNDNNGATAPAGADSAGYHLIAASKRNDNVSKPLVEGIGDLESAYVAIADLWRSYESHRLSTIVHGTPDTSNSLAALPPLLRLHKEFLAVLASSAPPVPATINSGVVTAVTVAGFKEA